MWSLLLFVSLLGLIPAFELIAAGPSHENYSDPLVQKAHKKFSVVKNISKRDVGCPKDSNGCDLCKPGFFKEKECTASEKTICKECEEGKEYTDDCNNLLKCKRCSSCDPVHGFEVDKPCNRTQNTKCTCMHGFFCNSSGHCHHCNPCTKCEDSIVVEECTQTRDTICRGKQNLLWIIGIVIPIMLIGILVIIIWIYRRRKNRKPKKQIKDVAKRVELEPLKYPDIDLTDHISDIAEEMNLEQVKKFVRKQGLSNPTIERIYSDHKQDAYEIKIKLLESWYQEKGIKDAFGTLMKSLKDLKMCVLAEKISQKIGP